MDGVDQVCFLVLVLVDEVALEFLRLDGMEANNIDNLDGVLLHLLEQPLIHL